MDPEERSMLAGCMHPEQFLVDENIVTQGESGDTMYILAMGQAHVMKTYKPVSAATVGLGDCCRVSDGRAWLRTGGEPAAPRRRQGTHESGR